MNKLKQLFAQPGINEYIVLVIYVVAILAGVYKHEMWRDELHAWQLAAASDSFSSLYHNFKYEGHGFLFEILLYILTKFTANITSMQWLNACITIAFAAVLLSFKHIRLTDKILLLLSYYFLYEYSVIARNYMVGILIVFMYLKVYQSDKFLLKSIICFLGFQVNIYVSVIMAILVLSDFLKHYSEAKDKTFKPFALPAFVILSGGILSLFLMLQSKGSIYNTPYNGDKSIERVYMTFASYFSALFPVPDMSTTGFWNSHILATSNSMLVSVPLTILLVFFLVIKYSQNKFIAGFFAVSTLLLLLFSYYQFMGYYRHNGHYFIILIVVFVLALHKAIYSSVYAITIWRIYLLIPAIAGCILWYTDFTKPFSTAKEVATFIDINRLYLKSVVGSRDYITFHIGAYLGRDIYLLESKKREKYVLGNRSAQKLTEEQKMDFFNDYIATYKDDIVYVQGNPRAVPFPLDFYTAMGMVHLYSTKGGLVRDENYDVFYIDQNVFPERYKAYKASLKQQR